MNPWTGSRGESAMSEGGCLDVARRNLARGVKRAVS